MIIKSPFIPFKLNEVSIQALTKLQNNLKNLNYNLTELKCFCDSETNDEIVTDSFYPNFINSEIKILICKNCGTLRSSPYLDDKSLEAFYTNLYYPLHSGINDTLSDNQHLFSDHSFGGGQGIFIGCSAYNFLKPFIQDYKKQFNKQKLKIFEIGCGNGGVLYKFHKDQEDVYGCDYRESGILNAKLNGINNCFIGGIETLKDFLYPDIIILNHVLEHIPNLDDFFINLQQYITKDTLIYIGVPNIITGPYHFDLNLYRIFEISHVWHFTNNTLDKLMAKYGFEKIESNEVIQSLYKNTGNTQNISLFNEYSKNKYILEALDKKYLSQTYLINQQANEVLNTINNNLNDLQIKLDSKTKKYKLRIKIITILLIFFIVLAIYLFLK